MIDTFEQFDMIAGQKITSEHNTTRRTAKKLVRTFFTICSGNGTAEKSGIAFVRCMMKNRPSFDRSLIKKKAVNKSVFDPASSHIDTTD